MEKESKAAVTGNAGRSSLEISPVIVLPAGSEADLRAREEPPEKVFYKTRFCDNFETNGRCAYGDRCTFAHGHAELRPPLAQPQPHGSWRSRLAPPRAPTQADNGGRVCFEFRDKGTCHYGEKCIFFHVSAAVLPAANVSYPRKAPESASRITTSPARGAFSAGSNIYGPATARAFPHGSDAAGQGKAKPTRLELLNRKKMSGIYGDWPEF